MKRHLTLAVAACALAALLLPASALASAAPAWRVSVETVPTNLPPGGTGEYLLRVRNVGAAPSDGTVVTLVDHLPPGIIASSAGGSGWGCSGTAVVTCTDSATVEPGLEMPVLPIAVAVEAGPDRTAASAIAVSGGGASEALSSAQTAINSSPAGFGLASFEQFEVNPDGSPDTQAGSHPYEMTTSFSPNNIGYVSGEEVALAGEPKDLEVALPQGFVGNPRATPRCPRSLFDLGRKERQEPDCPADTGVGTVEIVIGGPFADSTFDFPVYNLEPPPGAPAQFGFAFQYRVGFINFGVRTGEGYALKAVLRNIDQLRILRASLSLWSVPAEHGTGAPVAAPLLTNPTSCGVPLVDTVSMDSWEEPGALLGGLTFPWTDNQGDPLQIHGCEALDFVPAIKEVQPTTNIADSPSGLEFDLNVAQNEEPAGDATSQLKDAVITLPPGLLVNPSSADGRASCSAAQIELNGPEPAACPDAAKLGTVEVDTPLIDHPLPGAVYLAKPFDNPFNSLLAIYIAVDDPVSGVVVKLAGHVEADEQTGQLKTTFTENPQLPFEDFKLHFFGGARGALRTPPTCGSFETTAELTPWSGTEPVQPPPDSFAIGAASAGGPCPQTPAEEPHKPSFGAGTLNPTAGAYSPFLLKLSREDGSQELKGIDATLPPGLVGKLAGVAECSDAQLAAAEHNTGAAEKQSPSCPLASQVGTVNVGAGAGPNPIYVQGHAYLAGPYKGAPLSLAIVTPAVAGPFDLGTVVVSTALYVNPETAQIHAVSDPLPTILQGIPLDLRSVALHMDRNQFTLNPTSCNETAVGASALSVLNQSAALSSRFQVGGCPALGFKPKLKIKLKGGTKRAQNPALNAVLTAKPGEANIAAAQVTLPKSEFLDNAHIGTVCTRVQFAANACPPASIYGHATAVTPLLDQPLSGPVYLRSSSNKLPDLVAALNGQITVDLDGKIDTGKGGGIRNTFEVLPDAPVTKFTLEMQGGNKGLLENSENLCSPKAKTHATVNLTGQNGKVYDTTPAVQNSCKKKSKAKHHPHKGGKAHR